MAEKSVTILGATGLVGAECLRQFAQSGEFERVVAVTRRALPPDLAQPRVETHVADFERLNDAAEYPSCVTHRVCARHDHP